MPVGHVGLSRGPRPFPNGFRTGIATAEPTPPTPPTTTVRHQWTADNRRHLTRDNRRLTIIDATFRTFADNRRRGDYEN